MNLYIDGEEVGPISEVKITAQECETSNRMIAAGYSGSIELEYVHSDFKKWINKVRLHHKMSVARERLYRHIAENNQEEL